MLNENVTKLLNQQVNKEFYSAYLYLNFSNYFIEKGLSGLANWFQVQAQEERDHAMLFIKYLQDNEIPVVLKEIAKPHATPDDVIAPFKLSLEHEKYITAQIHNLYEAASENKDYRTCQFLDWFIKEQGEEEATASDLLTRMELFGSDPKGLYLMDQELGARAYTAPTFA